MWQYLVISFNWQTEGFLKPVIQIANVNWLGRGSENSSGGPLEVLQNILFLGPFFLFMGAEKVKCLVIVSFRMKHCAPFQIVQEFHVGTRSLYFVLMAQSYCHMQVKKASSPCQVVALSGPTRCHQYSGRLVFSLEVGVSPGHGLSINDRQQGIQVAFWKGIKIYCKPFHKMTN